MREHNEWIAEYMARLAEKKHTRNNVQCELLLEVVVSRENALGLINSYFLKVAKSDDRAKRQRSNGPIFIE